MFQPETSSKASGISFDEILSKMNPSSIRRVDLKKEGFSVFIVGGPRHGEVIYHQLPEAEVSK